MIFQTEIFQTETNDISNQANDISNQTNSPNNFDMAMKTLICQSKAYPGAAPPFVVATYRSSKIPYSRSRPCKNNYCK